MRRTEVACGLLLILVSFSFMVSMLLDFTFVSSFASPMEDLFYLAENVIRQRFSTLSWFVSSVLIAISIPLYILVFRGRQRFFHYLNALVMCIAVVAFVLMSQQGLILYREISALLPLQLEEMEEATRLSLLNHYKLAQWYRLLGSSAVGVWTLGLVYTRVVVKRVPMTAVVLFILTAPALIYFNWTDPDHLLRTVALTGQLVGTMIFSVRLVNRGLGY